MKVFVPFSETLIEELGLSLGDLVPFNLDYECLRAHELAPPGRSVAHPSNQIDPVEPVQLPQPAAHPAINEQRHGISA
ncbi:MAG: hypothetical protein V3T18_01970 [Pseudomonadales bacterium]